MREFAVTLEEWPEAYVARVYGQIDLATAGRLQAALQAALSAMRTPLVVDLSPVTYLDSAAITALLAVRRSAFRRGCPVLLVTGTAFPRKVLGLMHLERLLPLHDTLPEALGSLAGPQPVS
ncbi:MAG: STAS domain-containing protein [Armatimonadetes bacterium]|nr:STAS domain-containing protein [Armatimonadota bacterium]